MANILINPNSGIMEFTTGTAGGSSFNTNFTGGAFVNRMSYDNYGGLNLTSYVSNATGLDRFSIDGTNGRLFSVTDNLSGSLFSVNDIAGLPIIEAFDDNTVIMGAFNRNDFVLTGNSLGLGGLPNTGTTKLYVSGNIIVSGNSSFSIRPTVNGTGVLLSGEAAGGSVTLPSGILYTSGTQTISGSKTFTSTGIFNSGIDLNNSNLINVTPEIINVSSNFNISGNYSSRMIMANSAAEITGTITAGNPLGFNTTIIQVGVGQILITGININEYASQYRTAGRFAAISILHTGNNGYIMYGNTGP